MSNHPPRPHAVPCACEQCVEWARGIVTAPAERKPPRQPPPDSGIPEWRRDMGLADTVSKFVEVACRATGLTPEELKARGAVIHEDVPERVEFAKREAVAARGVPEIHLEAVYDREPANCDAIDAVCAFVTSKQTLLVLSGGVGLRKTGSACYALVQKPGLFITADEISTVAVGKSDDEREKWARCRRAQVLVIDDLGGEYLDDKGWFFRVLNGLIDHRYSMKLKTIMTTNLEAATFKRLYGERIVDRIREAGRWVNLGGVSVRRQTA